MLDSYVLASVNGRDVSCRGRTGEGTREDGILIGNRSRKCRPEYLVV